ncbi:TPA: hypothetical protein PXN14_000104 [Yersinia enterocolitica]|uniref:Uncharacterized protein n=1 Tax=Yersinia enterocolitica W22703 TaxID=913028 RepID=F4N2H9_YEREN|nr:hypothetical protein [Yersinia enterocolitica]QCW23328.1 hypothetical protein [Yersinia phage YeP4]QCW23554.1 hypothetical protein [Yersinia phage YeP5]QCW23592.1 hypothetical protein [Yersinia phage YeP6]CBX72287.1 unknown protein [Yersinia enterocolitica W22703]ADZ41841.1 hypothetical protein YE105_C1345 [Yersinia enterocolitica subsp. palearctica 105.5R(r)]
MARPKTKIEVPGQETLQDDATDLIGTAGEDTGTALTVAEALTGLDSNATTEELPAVDHTARNEALTGINAAGFTLITRFEELGFVDAIGHPLTNCLDFIELVKQATTEKQTGAGSVGSVGAIGGASQTLTDAGWIVQ